MKKFKSLSKTLLASFVIFHLSIVAAATPVVALAMEENASQASEASASQEGGGEVSETETKGDEGRVPPGKGDPTQDNPKPIPGDPKPEGDPAEENGSSTSSSRASTKDTPKEEPSKCETSPNLLTNGGFENPAVENYSWNIYTDIPGWEVEWAPGSGDNTDAKLELQRNIYTPHGDNQYLELDSDFDGPDGAIENEEALTKISQTITTVPGHYYEISYYYSARPGYGYDDNAVGLLIDGYEWDMDTVANGVGHDDAKWYLQTNNFTADSTSHTISFVGLGNANSFGMFLDDIKVVCDQDGPDKPKECPSEQIYARVKFAKKAAGAAVDGWRNWGAGDVQPQVYVGGNTPGHLYADEEWFPLTNADGTFINDADINTYKNVRGLAVERQEGTVRVVLYGEHAGEDEVPAKGEPPFGKEMAYGVVEITNNAEFEAGIQSPYDWGNDNSNQRLHDPYVQDFENQMDSRQGFNGYINQYNPRFDRMKTWFPQKTAFHLVVTTGNDGFYAHYTPDNLVDDCDGEQNFPPEITVFPTEVIVTVGGFYDIMNGVTADDLEDGDITEDIVATGTIDFNTIGNYTIYYDVTDSDGLAAVQKSRIIHVVTDGGNGDEWPDLAIPGQVCLEDSVVEYDFDFGVSATDDQDGDLTGDVTNDSDTSVTLGTIGDYTVTYSVTDSDSHTTMAQRPVHIRADCDDDGGGDDDDDDGDDDDDDDDDNGANPVITVNPMSVCLDTRAISYDFMTGVSATDAEDGNLTSSITHNGNLVIFGTPGVYIVTYMVTDSDGNVDAEGRMIEIDTDCTNGGGTEDDPSLSFTDLCILSSATSFDFMTGVTVTDDEGAGQVTVFNNAQFVVTFGTEGDYTVMYVASDSDGNSAAFNRTITIDNDCDNGDDDDDGDDDDGDDDDGDDDDGDDDDGDDDDGDDDGDDDDNGDDDSGDDDDDDSSGGGSSSGSRRNRGEVLGADIGPACIRFTEYHDAGDVGGEIEALQVFLNEYMGAEITVDGVYGRTTAQAVHDFQAAHWDDVIDPWTPPLSANTTGRFYKTTLGTADAILGCAAPEVFLEDPQTTFFISEVKDQKTFTEDQIAKVVEKLSAAQALAINN